jgi:tetratricopeptide (TPR) repeat protein
LTLFEGFGFRGTPYFESSPDDLLKWHREMGEYALRHGHLETAAWHLNQIFDLNRDDVPALKLRAGIYAELGDWVRARRDFERLLQLDPGKVEFWERMAVACLASGDLAGYAKVCSETIKHFGLDNRASTVRDVAALLRWNPWPIDETKRLISQLRQAALERSENPIYRREYAIGLCRCGDWEQGLVQLEQYRHMGTGPHADLLGGAFLTLAYEHVGKDGEARRLWQDVGRRTNAWLGNPSRDGGPDWATRDTMTRLRQEVEHSLLDHAVALRTDDTRH